MSAPHEHLETSFPDTQPLPRGLSTEAQSLLDGHLGDESYRIPTKSEQLELLRKIGHTKQAATMVVLDTSNPPEDQLVFVFNSNVISLNEAQERLEFDLPIAAPHIGRGLTLRGSIKLQGVILTFECAVLSTQHSADGKDNALVTALPTRLFRLQRRDSFRVPVSSQTPIHVTLNAGAKHLGRVRVLDPAHPTRSPAELFRLRRRMGVLLQGNGLLTDLSVAENVALPLRTHTALPEPVLQVLVRMKLHAVGLLAAADAWPRELSGGMARRVALARALGLGPPPVV